MLEPIKVNDTSVVGVYDKSKMTPQELFVYEALEIIKGDNLMSTEQRVNHMYGQGYRKIHPDDIKTIMSAIIHLWLKKEMPQEIIDIYETDPSRSMQESVEIWLRQILMKEE